MERGPGYNHRKKRRRTAHRGQNKKNPHGGNRRDSESTHHKKPTKESRVDRYIIAPALGSAQPLLKGTGDIF